MEFQFSPTVESLEAVPMDFRGLYAEKEGGGFALRDTPEVKSAVSAITGLSRALKAARTEAQGWKGKSVDLSALAEYGDSPESILAGFQNALTEATKGKKTQEDFLRQIEKVKADLSAQHAKEIQQEKARSQALQGQLYGHLVTSEARGALAEAGALDPDLVLPFLTQQVKVVEDKGQFLVNVVDGAGDPRYSGVTGAPLSVKELVQEIKLNAKYGPLFKSDAPGGAGSNADRQRRAPVGGKENRELSPVESIAAGLAKKQRA